MNAKPGVLAVMDSLHHDASVSAHLAALLRHQIGASSREQYERDLVEIGRRLRASDEARATVERMAQTLAFIKINAAAGELSAEGCAIQARAALAAFRGEA